MLRLSNRALGFASLVAASVLQSSPLRAQQPIDFAAYPVWIGGLTDSSIKVPPAKFEKGDNLILLSDPPVRYCHDNRYKVRGQWRSQSRVTITTKQDGTTVVTTREARWELKANGPNIQGTFYLIDTAKEGWRNIFLTGIGDAAKVTAAKDLCVP